MSTNDRSIDRSMKRSLWTMARIRREHQLSVQLFGFGYTVHIDIRLSSPQTTDNCGQCKFIVDFSHSSPSTENSVDIVVEVVLLTTTANSATGTADPDCPWPICIIPTHCHCPSCSRRGMTIGSSTETGCSESKSEWTVANGFLTIKKYVNIYMSVPGTGQL